MLESFVLYIVLPVFLTWVLVNLHVMRKQNSYLVSLATRDELTGLRNKRGGNELLKHHHSVLERNPCVANSFSVLYIDIDRFKEINDTYGHHMGDMAIKFIGELLTKTVRGDGHDIVIRWSGDEFGVILPHCDFQKAEIIRQKIKDALLVSPFEAEGMQLILSVSVGIATAFQKDQPIRSLSHIVRVADESMYQEKPKKRRKHAKKETKTS
jgi:diguanylate cyclase (GGDEF)-like protein